MLYNIDDVIGNRFTVLGQLGEGGCAIVYRVYSHEMEQEIALKTFHDEYACDLEARQIFVNEAKVWLDLGFHQNIVDAYLVEFIGGRQFIGMELVLSSTGESLTLEDCLTKISLKESIIWSIQFCEGMTFAYSQGIKVHLDIKPRNILISDNDIIKISDFGFASILQDCRESMDGRIFGNDGNLGIVDPSQLGPGIGTFEYMSPEQKKDPSQCDIRSDIFSYGVVLFQMISQKEYPEDLMKLNSLKQESIKASPLFPICQKCMKYNPNERYQNFVELKDELEKILYSRFGERYVSNSNTELKIGDYVNRGNSYAKINFHTKAINYFDKALEKDPNLIEAILGKAISLTELNSFNRAKELFDKAIELAPTNTLTWLNRGCFYKKIGQISEAAYNFRKTLELNPADSFSYHNLGICLFNLEKFEEAIPFFDLAYRYDPDLIESLCSKSSCLFLMGNLPEAMICFDQILCKDPLNLNTLALKAQCLFTLGHIKESSECLDKSLTINPDDPFLLYIRRHGFENIHKYTDI